MTRKEPVIIVVKENRRVVDRIKAKSGAEAARILDEKYGGLGVMEKRSRNPLPGLDEDLPGTSLFGDDDKRRE